MSSQMRRSSWSSRIRETWRSALSWMHWSRRRQERREQEREILLARVEATLRVLLEHQARTLMLQQRELLWEMALPMAEALTRMDKRNREVQMQQGLEQELLLEILQGQMPPVSQQLGLSSPPPSFQHSVS